MSLVLIIKKINSKFSICCRDKMLTQNYPTASKQF